MNSFFSALFGVIVGACLTYKLNQLQDIRREKRNEIRQREDRFISSLITVLAELEQVSSSPGKTLKSIENNFEKLRYNYVDFRECLDSPRRQILEKAWLDYSCPHQDAQNLGLECIFIYQSTNPEEEKAMRELAIKNIRQLIKIAKRQ